MNSHGVKRVPCMGLEAACVLAAEPFVPACHGDNDGDNVLSCSIVSESQQCCSAGQLYMFPQCNGRG